MAEKLTVEKTCIFCKHFYFDPGYPDWSEVTPGQEASVGCYKYVYPDYSLSEITLNKYRELILTAQSCSKFEQSDFSLK